MAEGKAIDKANLELALSENNERLLKYTDAADIALRQDLNAISQYQKYINTELDYCYLTLSNTENVSLSVDYVLPFLKFNGNMETNEINYSAILKAGKTYKISCDLYTADNGRSVFNVFDMTNNKIISYFIKAAAKNDTTASNTNSATIYTPENDCEIQIKVNFISGSQRIEPNQNNYFIIQEIGRSITIDPVEYINTQNGIEDTPVGHILTHMGTKAPKHYLMCNGTEYNILDYPYLAQHFKDEFGSYNYFGGDGITTFAVPDLRGEFLRGTGTNSHINEKLGITEGSGANVGKHQDATTERGISINTTGAGWIRIGSRMDTLGNTSVINPDTSKKSGVYDVKWNLSWDASGNKAEDYTSRPTNTSVLYCIKYEPTYYMNVTQTISLEEANELKEQNQLLKKQNQLLQQEIEALNVIIDSNKTTI